MILFVGDGMGMSTITAARIFKGQLAGESGENATFSFENFPHTSLAKVTQTWGKSKKLSE